MEKQKKGVRLEHISKIYNDPKTGKASVLIYIRFIIFYYKSIVRRL